MEQGFDRQPRIDVAPAPNDSQITRVAPEVQPASATPSDGPTVGESAQVSDHRRGLAPPQFSLASLLGVMTLLALVLALSDVIGAYGTFWLIVFIVAVIAHVAGNALGRQLKEEGSRPLANTAASNAAATRPVRYAPRTRLSEHHASSHWVVFVTFAGAFLGATGGGYWLLQTMSDQFTIGALAVALIAFAVLGGIWSFLAIGFVYVLIGAWRQSVKHK